MVDKTSVKEKQVLFSEVVSLFHRLKAVATEIHEDAEVTATMRGVLNELAKSGPNTVPRMARRRPVSRQHLQSIVNGLLKRDLVSYRENPDHKTSRLVALTTAGREVVDRMRERESLLLRRFRPSKGADSLRVTCEVLAEVRTWFEGSCWKEFSEEDADKRSE